MLYEKKIMDRTDDTYYSESSADTINNNCIVTGADRVSAHLFIA
jgi:hypothetical protein